jgi:hypothetical protein
VQGPRRTFAGFCVAVIGLPRVKYFALESWPGPNPAIVVVTPSLKFRNSRGTTR